MKWLERRYHHFGLQVAYSSRSARKSGEKHGTTITAAGRDERPVVSHSAITSLLMFFFSLFPSSCQRKERPLATCGHALFRYRIRATHSHETSGGRFRSLLFPKSSSKWMRKFSTISSATDGTELKWESSRSQQTGLLKSCLQ